MAFALCLTLLLSAFAGGAMAEEEPVVIENMGRTTTYEEAPETAVALSYSIAEIMVALGLEDKIVAIAPSMYILDQVSEEYRETVGSFPVLEGNYGVPTLETVLDTGAEFVFGDAYSFYASAVGTVEDFEAAGVNIYATEGTYVEDATFENTIPFSPAAMTIAWSISAPLYAEASCLTHSQTASFPKPPHGGFSRPQRRHAHVRQRLSDCHRTHP